jgi:isopenicillin-N N-acyltransferase-like protein
MNRQHTFPLVTVRGSSYEMGRQHGEQAAPLVERYLRWIERLTKLPRQVLCHNAMQFLPSMEALSQAFVEEVRGLGDSAGISFEEAVLCQVRAEAAHTYPAQKDGCTAFALTGEATASGTPLAGQNQDLQPEYADVAILLHVQPADGRPRALMFTFAGQLGYSGMNVHGVAHFANSLYDALWQPGIAHYPLKRVMLEQRTVAECVALLRSHRTCSAGNVMLCDGVGAVGDVEVRPEGIAVFTDDHPDMRLHANHYITPEFASYETNSLADSCPRLDRMRQLVQQHWGQITVETMKAILADHAGDPAGICRHGAVEMHSISGYIADPAAGVLHVRRGHGCLGTWTAYDV